jgi:hypothetical protein
VANLAYERKVFGILIVRQYLGGIAEGQLLAAFGSLIFLEETFTVCALEFGDANT